MILQFLDELAALWAPLGGLRSLVARSALAAVLAFGLALWMGPRVLRWLRRRHYLECETATASARLNEINAGKGPTPTMGGIMIVGAVFLAAIVFGDLNNPYVQLALLTTLGYGLIGCIDDWIKLTRPGRRGLQAAGKYGLQLLVACSLSLAITILFRDLGRRLPELYPQDYGPGLLHDLMALHVPFTGGFSIDLSMWGGLPHMLLVLLVVTGTSNAVNLTDGMDGLAAGALAVAALAMGAVCVAVGRARGLELEQLLYVPFSQEMTVFCTAMAGATLGFLWFNAAPALVYMGDTGSLPLGSLLGYVAVVTKQELLLILIGGVFVIEALSVILQVGYFKVSGGRRLFLCAPLHHHFQFQRVPETRIVVRFWIGSILFAAAGLASLAVL